jgi:hypothetical protein
VRATVYSVAVSLKIAATSLGVLGVGLVVAQATAGPALAFMASIQLLACSPRPPPSAIEATSDAPAPPPPPEPWRSAVAGLTALT